MSLGPFFAEDGLSPDCRPPHPCSAL